MGRPAAAERIHVADVIHHDEEHGEEAMEEGH